MFTYVSVILNYARWCRLLSLTPVPRKEFLYCYTWGYVPINKIKRSCVYIPFNLRYHHSTSEFENSSIRLLRSRKVNHAQTKIKSCSRYCFVRRWPDHLTANTAATYSKSCLQNMKLYILVHRGSCLGWLNINILKFKKCLWICQNLYNISIISPTHCETTMFKDTQA